MNLPFLLEIGTEEIPDWMIPNALENLHLLFEKLELPHESVTLDATPRRLVLRVDGLPDRQADSEERVLGPAKSAPPQAVAGFARKQGIKPEDLVVESTPKGEYYTFTKKVEGRRTIHILADALPGIILGIYFPKTMYWTAKNGPRFIRPIRWIVALLGEETVPFEIAGVRSGNLTAGHRSLGAREVVVTPADYVERLRDHYVILSAEERRGRIQNHFASLHVKSGRVKSGRVKADPALLETLTYLTEFPTPITGSFDPQFLELPEEVLVTVMRHHQKYFSVEDAEGKLAPQFVAVMNIPADPEGFVRSGNERVLRARFNDARFFWETDQKKPLVDRKQDLAHVTFQAKLGSYLEKTDRTVALTAELGGDGHAQRAAELLKCDLTTELVKEFTELQGVVGGLYARAQGEPEPVWQAIYDQYKPAGLEDSIPRNRTGQIVSLADKLDTLRGCFAIGMIPTGSRDPFALRRAAQGVVKILVEGKLELPLRGLIQPDEALVSFFEDRVRYYFRDHRGFKYDEVSAAMATKEADWANLVDLEGRLLRIQSLRTSPDFVPVVESYKRITNILEQGKYIPADDYDDYGDYEPGAELALYQYLVQEMQGRPIEQWISGLQPRLASFFEQVMVLGDNLPVRQRRLKLLRGIQNEFTKTADFSLIVTTS